MTKRIIALLVAVVMAASCLMLVACGEDTPATSEKPSTSEKTSTSEPKTSEQPSEPATSEASEPATSEASEPAEESSEAPDDPPAGDGFYGSLEATEVMCDLYSTTTPWENWNGYFQFLPQLYKEEVDATENVGTEDYEWTWTIYAAPASDDGNVADEASFQKIEGQIETFYDWKSEDGKVIYRIMTGSLTKDWVVDQDYEVIIVVSKGDDKFKCQLFPTWTQDSADCQTAWVAGYTGKGELEDNPQTFEEAGYERHTPTTCPCDY